MSDGWQRRAFGMRLLRTRVRARVSRNELARRAGISVSAIRHIEGGRSWPRFDTLVLICQGLGVTTAEAAELSFGAMLDTETGLG